MSEYGFQGMPNLETLEKVIHKEDLNFTSEAFKNHQKHPTGYETINEYMERDYVRFQKILKIIIMFPNCCKLVE
jgi:beta-mannosidase